MYTDPKTKEVIVTHPAELARIPDFRDHGFDELNPIHKWITAELEKHEYNPFFKTYYDSKDNQPASNYIFVRCEKDAGAAVKHFNVEIEVGFVDFQDDEISPIANISFILFENSKLITLKTAESQGKETDDVVRVLSDITDGPYLNFTSVARPG